MSHIFEKQLVMAFFDEPAAVVALASLQDEPSPTLSGCSLGLLAKDGRGRVVTAMLGPRTDGAGVAVGAVLGMIALALAGGTLPNRDNFLNQGSELTIDDITRFAAELDARRSAVAVLGAPGAVEPAVVELTRLGGKTEMHGMTREGLDRVLSAPSISA
jgi:hypothetical protein